jgi:hypothetical protein
MGRWGDGEMGRWGDGEMGRWGDGEMGSRGEYRFKFPSAPLPLCPSAPLPLEHTCSPALLLEPETILCPFLLQFPSFYRVEDNTHIKRWTVATLL